MSAIRGALLDFAAATERTVEAINNGVPFDARDLEGLGEVSSALQRLGGALQKKGASGTAKQIGNDLEDAASAMLQAYWKVRELFDAAYKGRKR